MSLFTEASEELTDAILHEFGDEYEYLPLSGMAYAVTLSLRTGQDVEDRYPGASHLAFGRLDVFTDPPRERDAVMIGDVRHTVQKVIPAQSGVLLELHYYPSR